jgi:hypothetical protein
MSCVHAMSEYAILRYDYCIALLHTVFVLQQYCLIHPYGYLGVDSPSFTHGSSIRAHRRVNFLPSVCDVLLPI